MTGFAAFNWFKEPLSRLTGANVTRDQVFGQVQAILLAGLEQFAAFVDNHDLVVPELNARYHGIEFQLTGRRLPGPDTGPSLAADDPAPAVAVAATRSTRRSEALRRKRAQRPLAPKAPKRPAGARVFRSGPGTGD